MPGLPQPASLPQPAPKPTFDPIFPSSAGYKESTAGENLGGFTDLIRQRYPGKPQKWYDAVAEKAEAGMPQAAPADEPMKPRGVRPIPRQKLAGEEVYRVAPDEPKTYRVAETTPEARDTYGLKPEDWMPKEKKKAPPAPPKDNPFAPTADPSTYELFDPRKAQTKRANEIRDQQNRDNQRRKEEEEAKKLREERAKTKAEEQRSGLQSMMTPLSNQVPSYLKPLLGAFGGKGGMLGGLADAAAGGAGMGGVGGMAGMMKLAGGPVGLALMAKEAIHAAGDKARQALESFGEAAGKIARNDMTVLGDGITGAGDTIGKVSPIFGELIKTAGTLVNVQQRAAQAFIDRGKELSKFSGPLAAANAQADIKRMQADMREAQMMGKSLSRLTEQQNRAEMAFREAMLPIKEAVVNKLTMIAERIAGLLEAHGKKFEFMAWALEAMVNFLSRLPGLGQISIAIMDKLTQIKKNTDKNDKIDHPPIDEWLGALKAMGPGFQRNDPEGPRANLNAPIHNFGGN